MDEIQCPACGSRDIEVTRALRSYAAPYGPAKAYEIEIARCRTCDESGDFREANDRLIKKVVEDADKESVDALVGWLHGAGVSMAYLERALSLPPRTVARWKAGGCSASGLALLRIVRCFPWVLDVAAARFNESAAGVAVIKAAAEAFATATRSAGYACSLQPSRTDSSTFELHARFQKCGASALETSAAAPAFQEVQAA